MEEIIVYLQNELEREKKLSLLCEKFNVSEFEILGLVYKLKENGVNIDCYQKDGENYLIRNEHPDLSQVNSYYFKEDVNDKTKIAVISDIRAGSKCEQFRVLNDMYLKFLKDGITKVFILGNLVEGQYKGDTFKEFGKSLITNDAYGQADHFIENFPHVDGIETYFITGRQDHSFSRKMNVGEYIASRRDDMTYLGPKSCNVSFNNVRIRMEQLKNGKAYTIAYPPQKYVRSMSRYENYDILMLSGEMNFQHFPEQKGMQIFSIPSVVSRTPRMINDSQSSTIGAYTFEIEYTKNGKLKRIVPTVSTYEPVNTRYFDFKKLNLIKNEDGELVANDEKRKNADYSSLRRLYNLMHKEEEFTSLQNRLEVNENELYGIIGTLKNMGMDIEINSVDGVKIVQKKSERRKMDSEVKPVKEDLHSKTFGVISDTHYCSIYSQPSMVNTFVYECYNRGIDMIYHVGDIVDGDYSRIRPVHNSEVFIWGASGQLNYVVNNLPKYPNIQYKGICGSHDQTHFFNYGLDLGKELEKNRPDFIYLGQDRAIDKIDNCVVELYHPGGGTSRILSTKPQNSQDQLPYSQRVDLSLWGHYHKNYYMNYDGVHTLLLPCNVDQSSYMMKNQLPNLMGDYFITIYYDDNGKIHYVIPEAMIFDQNDVRKRDYENPKKYLKNKIITMKTSK